ncbi:hypothetical protein [uncultured Microbacterium sp.]|uniref:hypothetical protein n=1 Tax=uncultured Microbacterium sp. TaxID=191216 RepID=UPI00260A662C|nr:hypothetical protein [uncultured Microbacterium sp.]
MTRTIATAVLPVALITMLALSGCAGGSDPAPTTPPPAAEVSTPAESSTPTEAETPTAPVSDIEASVAAFTAALDELGIEHSEPVRAEVGLSGAKARFDITVNGYDAGINVFPDEETLSTWGEASDSFGGIYVSYGNAVLTLNSSEGIANSAEIAPQIAAAVGGEAHGV